MTKGTQITNLERQAHALEWLRQREMATTSEIARAVWMEDRGYWQPECRTPGGWSGCSKHCPKVWVPNPHGPYPNTANTRNALIRLMGMGLVERVDVPNSRKQHWRATSSQYAIQKWMEDTSHRELPDNVRANI